MNSDRRGLLTVPIATLTLCLGSAAAGDAANPDLPGWRAPAASDFTADWAVYKDELPTPYHASADFDGDSVEDHAWLLLAEDGDGWALFVFLSTQDVPIKLYEDEHGANQPQYSGVSVAPADRYQTVCGKGYFDCDETQPDEVILERSGFFFFTFESAHEVWWWDAATESMQVVSLSD